VAQVFITAEARRDIDAAASALELPPSHWSRIARSLRVLETFPLAGRRLNGRWAPLRFVLGPWPWMILLYRYDKYADRVFVVAMHDARSGGSALTG
jgi:plasmid stabilization system protein ParE